MPRVLLAEDDPTMIGLLTTLLRMDGFEVSAIDDGDDITAAVLRERPGFLLLDVHLADRNGLDVLEEIRRTDVEHRTRVIIVSGLNVKDESLRRGADGFLLKPFPVDELVRMLRKHIPAA